MEQIRTLLEQMRMTDSAVRQRKALFSFGHDDADALVKCAPTVLSNIDSLVAEFYRIQTADPEIALLIGDADTLNRVRNAQRKYIIDLFSGSYDLEYVNNRLRIGLVHKRIGVEPKLYLSATHLLKSLLERLIKDKCSDSDIRDNALVALGKLLFFDVTLIVETYIRSLVSEIETSKERSEQYARDLEIRSQQLEQLSRVDPLTGLLNRRSLDSVLKSALANARLHAEPVTLVYVDIDDFKGLNDRQGHHRGDEVLRVVGDTLLSITRKEDDCFRLGGDEFCVVLPRCDQTTAESEFRNRLTRMLTERLPGVTVSVGIRDSAPPNHLEAADLIQLADSAMFEAKARNKGQRSGVEWNEDVIALPKGEAPRRRGSTL